MGASSAREQLESQMLKLKLRRVEIKQERIERLKQLEEMTGKEVIREPIPDYIDHSEDEINIDDIQSESEEKEEKKKKKKKGKKNKKEKDGDEDEYEQKIKKASKKKKHKHNNYEETE